MIRLLLVDDSDVFRYGLGLLFGEEPDIEVVGTAADGMAAIALALDLRPDVVVMDVAMPTMDGVTATQQLLSASPATRVLMLSQHDDDFVVRNAVRAGALGYLAKTSSPDQVLDAIRCVHRGEPRFSPSTARPGPGLT